MEYSKTKKLMGTEITITIFSEKDPNQDIEKVFDIFHNLEEEFSRFISESRLSILNKKRTAEVSDTFIDVLKKCKKLYTDTDFYFNPLINVRQLGYSNDFHSKQFKKEDTELHVNLQLEKIEIQGNRVSLHEGQNLDLGGIVKGYGVDKAKTYLDKAEYENYIVDAGGDIYTAGTNEIGGKIVIGIDSPYTKGNIFATIDVENIAIATSGTYKRKWIIEDQEYIVNPKKSQGNEAFLDGGVIPTIGENLSTNKVKGLNISKTVEYNHIINPITTENNNEIVSITLIADTCYLADAYATACIAMGLEKTLAFLKKKHLEGIIMCSNKKAYMTKGMEKYNVAFI